MKLSRLLTVEHFMLAAEVIRALRKVGFEVTRIKGSHHVMRHRDDPSRGTVVPAHAGRDLKRTL